MKKCLPIIFAALLMVSALTGCAGQRNLALRNSSSEQNNAAVQNSEPAISQSVTSTNGTANASPAASTNVSAAYEKLIAYKTEGYEKQSIAGFNAALASTPDELTEFLAVVADVSSIISHDDENYVFLTQQFIFRQMNYTASIWEKNLHFLCPSPNKADCATIWTRMGRRYMVLTVLLRRMWLIPSMLRNL